MRRLFLAVLLTIPAAALCDTRVPQPRLAYTQLADPRQEAKARALMSELRCLVCQGQSIADSDADIAGVMRALVRERIARGETPHEISDWLTDRYGDYITYAPPLSVLTAPLWLAPIVLLTVGALIARASFRRGRR